MRTGKQIIDAERFSLVKVGSLCKDDTLPKGALQKLLFDGPTKGMVYHLDEMLTKCCHLWG